MFNTRKAFSDAMHDHLRAKTSQVKVEDETKAAFARNMAISNDRALDRAYGYGTANPVDNPEKFIDKSSPAPFGWHANKLVAQALTTHLDAGGSRNEDELGRIASDAWNEAAKTAPDRHLWTEKQVANRTRLMSLPYEQKGEEMEKDRVVGRAAAAFWDANRGKGITPWGAASSQSEPDRSASTMTQ